MKRLVYLDVLRGIAILLMVVDHAFDWWLNAAGQAGPWGHMTEFAGTLAAPLFLFLVGVGLVLSYDTGMRKGKPRREIIFRFFRRGVLIFLSGYLLNLLIFYTGTNPQDIWATDVLHTIGLSIILLIPLLWQPAPLLIAVLLALLVMGQTAGHWALPGWVEAFLTTGYFPLALWLPYGCMGLVFARIFHKGSLQKGDLWILLGLGLLCFVLILFVNPGWGYRHPKPVFVLFSFAVILWSLVITWTWTERLARRGLIVRILQEMGQASLMLYVFHHLVGYRLFWWLGWVSGRSWRGEYGVFAPIQAAGLFVILVFLMALASRWWLRQQENSRPAAEVRPTLG